MNSPEPRSQSPFLFVSGTSSAFVLLIALAFSTTAIYAPQIFHLVSIAGSPIPAAVREECNRAALDGTDKDRYIEACAALKAGVPQDLRPGILLCFATLILLTAVQYRLGPAWRIRRRRLSELDRDPYREQHDELHRMAGEHLPGRKVQFLVDLLDTSVGGLAFGRLGRRYVVLSRGTLDLFEQDRSMFRTVVLHELAHIRNRDVDITALTIALWRSYFLVILLPELLAAYISVAMGVPPVKNPEGVPFVSGPALSWQLAAQITGLTFLSRLTRSTVLQARELQADARVLAWLPGAGSRLLRLFGATRDSHRPVITLRHRTHPHRKVRMAAITEPGILLRQGFTFSFALGACFSLTMDPAMSLTATVRGDKFYWPAELFVLLLAVTLGIRALRASATPADGPGAPLGLAVGMATGWMLAPSRMTDHGIAPFPVTVQLAGVVVLAAGGWLLGLWVRWVAAHWEPAAHHASQRTRIAGMSVGLVALVVLLSAKTLYATQSYIIVAYGQHDPAVSDPLALVLLTAQRILDRQMISGIWLPAALVLLMAFPLLFGAAAKKVVGYRRTPHRRHRRVGNLFLAFTAGAGAAILSVAVSSAANEILLGRSAELLDQAAGIGAGLAAAAAYRARTSPVAKGILAALVGGLLLLALRELLPSTVTPRWAALMWILGRLLESALLAALLAGLLRHLRTYARRAERPLGPPAP
ncbi:M48 family metalloprotease [Streptosporangium sp. CA-135522]|uniref:M48 family metalloprotease n=1 Tax=Streptosporangium sp. CA-135522 TaxID=3240072 RepID=UPI003D89DDA8